MLCPFRCYAGNTNLARVVDPKSGAQDCFVDGDMHGSNTASLWFESRRDIRSSSKHEVLNKTTNVNLVGTWQKGFDSPEVAE